MLAPIVLFVYNRPNHTLKTLHALSRNELADQSILYICSDGYNENSSIETIENIESVRSIIKQQKWCKDVIIEEFETNRGLANSIIYGVSKIVNLYGKVIVLEDDLLTATTFLKYMNYALDMYETNMKVMQISGFSYNPPKLKALNSSYFLPISSTWGWGTWKRVWNSVDFECSDYIKLKRVKHLAYKFNFDGSYNYTRMFCQQMESNKISSWGIRFYWNLFKQNGLILFPDNSLVKNIGWDNSGRHSDSYEVFPPLNWQEKYEVYHFPVVSKVEEDISTLVQKYIRYRTNLYTKIFQRLLSLLRIIKIRI